MSFKKIIVSSILLVTSSSYGAVVEFPDQELASESVLPIFDRPSSVRSRNIVNKEKFELGVFSGFSLVEPFYSQYGLGISSSYNFDEVSALHVSFFYWLSGITSQAEALRNEQGIFLEKAPVPNMYLTGEYQHSAFYGKISASKNYVLNTHLYGLIGGGILNSSGTNNFTFNFGLGQKFYFSRKWALRIDLRGLLYSGANPLRGPDGRPPDEDSGNLPSSSFESHLIFSTLLSIGMAYHF